MINIINEINNNKVKKINHEKKIFLLKITNFKY